MGNKHTLGLLFVYLLFASFNSFAAVIDMGDYQYDEDTDLQWLDLTHTFGKNYAQVTDEFADWTLATETQWRTMYCKYGDCTGGDGRVFDQTSTYRDYADWGFESIEVSDFSDYITNYQPTFAVEFGSVQSSNSNYDKRTLGYYINDVDNVLADSQDDLRIGGLEIINSSSQTGASNLYDYTGGYGDPVSNPNISSEVVGWYLVREMSTVPIPSALLLFGSALIGLVGISRKK